VGKTKGKKKKIEEANKKRGGRKSHRGGQNKHGRKNWDGKQEKKKKKKGRGRTRAETMHSDHQNSNRKLAGTRDMREPRVPREMTMSIRGQ